MSREGKCSDTSYSIAPFPLHRSTCRWLDAQTPHLHDPELERRPCCGCCIAGQYVISVADIPFYLFPIRYIRYLLTTSCEVWSALSHCANVRGLADKFAVLSFTHCRCVEFVNLIWQNIFTVQEEKTKKEEKKEVKVGDARNHYFAHWLWVSFAAASCCWRVIKIRLWAYNTRLIFHRHAFVCKKRSDITFCCFMTIDDRDSNDEFRPPGPTKLFVTSAV